MTVPLAPIIGFIAAPAVRKGIQLAIEGKFDRAMVSAGHFIGVRSDGSFNAGLLFKNILPIIAGLLIHKFVGGPPLNLNKILARAKVPFIRI